MEHDRRNPIHAVRANPIATAILWNLASGYRVRYTVSRFDGQAAACRTTLPHTMCQHGPAIERIAGEPERRRSAGHAIGRSRATDNRRISHRVHIEPTWVRTNREKTVAVLSDSEAEKQPEASVPRQSVRQRIVSLDQFRGYTVLGMFLVNFVGSFTACHYVLRHHNIFCSYADTIMPHFLFAVGFAFRLTFGRRAKTQGLAAAHLHVVRRLLGLVLIALVIYTVSPVAQSWDQLRDMGVWHVIRYPLKRDWFQTLMHIAVTSLWILPVIRARAGVRVAYMVASAVLHMVLSYWFYFAWVNGLIDGVHAIDGGPLGFLTWTIPTMVGTLACDAVAGAAGRPRLGRMIAWSALLMGFGYLVSCGTTLYDVPPDQVSALAKQRFADDPVIPSSDRLARARAKIAAGHWTELLAEPPFIPPPHLDLKIHESYRLRKWNYWMMSQRSGTISYLTFSAGFSLAVYVLFYVACDIYPLQWSIFRTFGMNALAGYILHMMVASAVKPFMPEDVPGWYMWAGCAVFMLITYLFVRNLEKNDIYIKL